MHTVTLMNRLSQIPRAVRSPNSEHGESSGVASQHHTPMPRTLQKVSIEVKTIELVDAGNALLSSIYCTVRVSALNIRAQFASTLVSRKGKGNGAVFSFDPSSNSLRDIVLTDPSVRYALLSVHAQSFDGELLGEASITLSSGRHEAEHEIRTLLLSKGKKVGDIRCTLRRPVEVIILDLERGRCHYSNRLCSLNRTSWTTLRVKMEIKPLPLHLPFLRPSRCSIDQRYSELLCIYFFGRNVLSKSFNIALLPFSWNNSNNALQLLMHRLLRTKTMSHCLSSHRE